MLHLQVNRTEQLLDEDQGDPFALAEVITVKKVPDRLLTDPWVENFSDHLDFGWRTEWVRNWHSYKNAKQAAFVE